MEKGGSRGTSLTDFTEVSCMGASLLSSASFFSLLPFSPPLYFPTSSQLVICSPLHTPSGRRIIRFLMLLLLTPFQLAQAKKPVQHYEQLYTRARCTYVCMSATCKRTTRCLAMCWHVESFSSLRVVADNRMLTGGAVQYQSALHLD